MLTFHYWLAVGLAFVSRTALRDRQAQDVYSTSSAFGFALTSIFTSR